MMRSVNKSPYISCFTYNSARNSWKISNANLANISHRKMLSTAINHWKVSIYSNIPLIFQTLIEPSLDAVMICSELGVKHKQVTALWAQRKSFGIKTIIFEEILVKSKLKS